MLFALICTDKSPEGLALRKETRREHVEFLTKLGDKLKLAGPFVTEDGTQPTGSLIVIEAESIEEVREIAAQDPYAKTGVFETVEVRPWNWIFGK